MFLNPSNIHLDDGGLAFVGGLHAVQCVCACVKMCESASQQAVHCAHTTVDSVIDSLLARHSRRLFREDAASEKRRESAAAAERVLRAHLAGERESYLIRQEAMLAALSQKQRDQVADAYVEKLSGLLRGPAGSAMLTRPDGSMVLLTPSQQEALHLEACQVLPELRVAAPASASATVVVATTAAAAGSTGPGAPVPVPGPTRPLTMRERREKEKRERLEVERQLQEERAAYRRARLAGERELRVDRQLLHESGMRLEGEMKSRSPLRTRPPSPVKGPGGPQAPHGEGDTRMTSPRRSRQRMLRPRADSPTAIRARSIQGESPPRRLPETASSPSRRGVRGNTASPPRKQGGKDMPVWG
ncbi:hypothetical protein CYMTET_24163 [Cymbomonas tetramitiformis]|uniref:Uncharacterized protein n=1 Tax=Cymbomonas tetramitiformis TaxID=36881 RepID=A0AAE0L0C1_9CHLO|nr:hypothetical protein CYMTET_24163 [Cymbomonas tetramitiformis]